MPKDTRSDALGKLLVAGSGLAAALIGAAYGPTGLVLGVSLGVASAWGALTVATEHPERLHELLAGFFGLAIAFAGVRFGAAGFLVGICAGVTLGWSAAFWLGRRRTANS